MSAVVIIVVILFLLALAYVVFRISLFMGRRAICTVVGTFRRHGADKPETAATLETLGLSTWPDFFGILRDYRPWALQTLVQANVVRQLIDGYFYLSEGALNESNLDAGCPPDKLMNF